MLVSSGWMLHVGTAVATVTGASAAIGAEGTLSGTASTGTASTCAAAAACACAATADSRQQT